MSVQMLQTGSLICFGLAALFLVIAVILFIVFDVPALFGELTGATQRKAIEDIRSQNEQTGSLNTKKKQNTDASHKKKHQPATQVGGTAKLSTAQLNAASSATAVLQDANATTVLSNAGATTVLTNDNNATTVLSSSGQPGNILNQVSGHAPKLSRPDSETTVLGSQNQVESPASEEGFGEEISFEYASSMEIIE